VSVQNFPYFLPLIELIAAIFATVYFKKYVASNEKYFLFFLWYTFLMDLTGVCLDYNLIDNSFLYEVFTVSSFLFYFYWYYLILKSNIFRRIAVFLTAIFMVMTTITLVISSLSGQGYAFSIGAIGILLLTILHFYQLLNGDEVLNVKYKLSFWISTALLLFYLGIIPLILLSKYLDIKGMSYNIIIVSLSIILYGCYIIGFIWTKKKYNRF
jgi:hypothetical protein